MPKLNEYAIEYRVGNYSNTYFKVGFYGIQDAERFRITKTSAFTWKFLKWNGTKWVEVLSR